MNGCIVVRKLSGMMLDRNNMLVGSAPRQPYRPGSYLTDQQQQQQRHSQQPQHLDAVGSPRGVPSSPSCNALAMSKQVGELFNGLRLVHQRDLNYSSIVILLHSNPFHRVMWSNKKKNIE